MLKKIEVGKPYPEKLRLKDGIALNADPAGLMCVVHLSRFESGDKKALGGPFSVAVLQAEEAFPCLAMRYHKNGLCFDTPFLAGHSEHTLENLRRAGRGLQIVITKGGHHTVRGTRLVGLSGEMMDVLKTAEGQEGMSRATLRRVTRRINSRYRTSKDVYEAADVRQDFG